MDSITSSTFGLHRFGKSTGDLDGSGASQPHRSLGEEQTIAVKGNPVGPLFMDD